ncbi:MAG: hypothetical protein COU40_01120 [Candidatus Moranbacteria bacterium CG10_big_fil_rev_8_21_14_0_10_35_21]|nr:MAG: hypothetical protein COU40_01120 [Candidatus Moranbacteria bacterium CG10_big_fil_rev_8_21_14_0_10_35_21]PJA88574.1 MAG: hypothetical protein CO139_02385 [Candidatus Moranbacteria bacterium CG_4_9_14_3_um_filter_36_9]
MVKELNKKAKSILFADPHDLFKKEKELVNKPFYFPGNNGKAVILIHGWTSTPYEVRRLGEYLNEKGYTVFGPQLKGHGTVPKDLENIHWQDWIEDIRRTYQQAEGKFEKIYLGGTSIGSNLAIVFAEEKPEIAGLILMATPYWMKMERIGIFLARLVNKFKKYNKKFYPPTFGLSTTITRLISYQTYPIASALESFDLVQKSREKFSKITQPCLILQSSSDHLIAKESLEEIYRQINSQVKERKYIKRAYHTFISDIKNEHIFEDILDFLEKN